MRRPLVGLVLALALTLALASSALASHTSAEQVTIGPAGGNGAKDAFLRGVSSDGSRAFFETDESLVVGDADDCDSVTPGLQGCFDIYQRTSAGTTTLISAGTINGNGAFEVVYKGASTDGLRVFFETKEPLDAADTDTSTDVYQRQGSTTTLISAGAVNGNGAFDATFKGSSDDGTRVFFESFESLVAGDSDGDCNVAPGSQPCRDVYERFSSTTTHVSTGANGAFNASFADSSADGLRVFFDTREQLGGDTDALLDIFQRNAGTTTLISTSTTSVNPADAFFAGAAADGTRVFWHTTERMAPTATDTDSKFDIYERASGATSHVSQGAINGNGAFDALLQGMSADGTRVLFESDEVLAAGDADTVTDIYQRFSGATTRISVGSQSPAGSFPASFRGTNANGTNVYFETAEPLETNDIDSQSDLYERVSTPATALVSIGPEGGNGPTPAGFDFVSATGTRVLFHTEESLTANDSDSFNDVYERQGTTTTLVSGGLTGGNGNFFADFVFASADASRAFYYSDETLASTDTDAQQDAFVAFTAPLFPRPGGGTPLRVPFVPAFVACTSPNTTHVAPALKTPPNDGSCNPATQESSLLTTSTVGSGLASAKFEAVVGNPGTPADEADFGLEVEISDIRKKSDQTDYVGKVLLSTSMRITDRANGSFETVPSTAQDTQFSIPIDCVATAGANGSNCNLTTTLDTLSLGVAKEGKRSVISAFSLLVKDAGTDGIVTSATCPFTCGTGDEQVFLRQGWFAP